MPERPRERIAETPAAPPTPITTAAGRRSTRRFYGRPVAASRTLEGRGSAESNRWQAFRPDENSHLLLLLSPVRRRRCPAPAEVRSAAARLRSGNARARTDGLQVHPSR